MTTQLLERLLAILLALASSTAAQQQTIQDAIAEIKQAIIEASTPPGPPTVTVSTAAQLQNALDTMPAGSEIRLIPGVRYVCHCVLPNRPGEARTVIRTEAPLPEGRITPEEQARLPILASPDHMPALRTAPGARGYLLQGLAFEPLQGIHGYASVQIGSGNETALEQYPADITFDRVFYQATTETQRRALRLDGRNVTVINSWIEGVKYVGADAQAIHINGPGPYHIENNFLEASGENLLVGGADPKLQDLVPSDITIIGNLMTKPLAWRTATVMVNGVARKYSVKNILELKNARGVRIADNVLERVWVESQTGYAVLFTPRNQEGRAPWSTVEDVVFERNTVRGMAGCVNILGTDDQHPSGRASRITVRDNRFLDYGSAWGGSTYCLSITSGPTDVRLERNRFLSGAGVRGLLVMDGAPIDRFVFTGNLAKLDYYGMFGSGRGSGTAALAHYAPGAVVTGNVLAGGVARLYPSGNLFPTVAEFAKQVTPDGELVPGSLWTEILGQ